MSGLRALRKARNWTQEDLVEKAGVSLLVISKIEKGRAVSRRSALKVCQAFGVELSAIEGVKVYPQAVESSSPLRALREAKGWSQQKLAEAVEVSVTTITNMEHGKAVNRLVMLLVCQALGVSVEGVIALNLFSKKEVELYQFLLQKEIPGERVSLRDLRKAKGWSQETLAALVGVSHDLISRAESGKGINRMSALLICQALEVPLQAVQGLKITSSMRGQAWIVPAPSNGSVFSSQQNDLLSMNNSSKR